MTDKKPKRPRDTNQLAKFIVEVATGESTDALPVKSKGKQRGGLAGGPARAKKLSSDERSSIARKAAKARWSH